MEQVDRLLTGGVVVTMNQNYDVFANGAIAIRDHKIVAVGPTDELLLAFQAADTVDCTGQIVMPGLVNAHTHLPMTLLRGLADDLRLDVWLMGYMMPVEREFVSPEFCYQGTLLAAAEMIRGGTTCVGGLGGSGGTTTGGGGIGTGGGAGGVMCGGATGGGTVGEVTLPSPCGGGVGARSSPSSPRASGMPAVWPFINGS